MPSVSFSGIASGIDGDAIIKALIDARKLANVPLETKIKKNETETTALEEFNTKLLALDGSVKDFLTLAGSAVSKTASSSDEDVLSATASAGAPVSTTSFTVQQLAKNGTISFNDRFTSADTPLAPGLAGPADMQITLGTGATQQVFTVTVDATTTLRSLTEQISLISSDNIQATVLNVGTIAAPQYALVINGGESGTEKGTLAVTTPPELAAAGLFQGSTVSQAQDAIINVSGVGQVVRPSNVISDLVPGLTISLKQVSALPTTITVKNDANKTATKLGDFVTAFNEIINYSNKNSKINRVDTENGVENQYESLAATRVDNQAVTSLRTALSSARSTDPQAQVHVFADLGITTEKDGTLKFDQEKFLDAVGKDGGSVDEILHKFADAVGGATGVISQYTRFNGELDLATKANTDENDSLNARLARLNQLLDKQKEGLQQVFANLESKIGRLNSTSSSLSSLLGGGSSGK